MIRRNRPLSNAGRLVAGIIALSVAFFPGSAAFAQPIAETAVKLRALLTERRGTEPLRVAGEPFHATRDLPRFYVERGYRPAWIDGRGLRPEGADLIRSLRDSHREGLDPEFYHLKTIERLTAELGAARADSRWPSVDLLAHLDFLLTDAFIYYGSHLLTGRTNPETFGVEVVTDRPDANFVERLRSAFTENRVRPVLAALFPQDPGYARLKLGLEEYRLIAGEGGWPQIPPGDVIGLGDRSKRVRYLRDRLAAEGFLDTIGTRRDSVFRFDADVDRALKRYQTRNGLLADGRLGPRTLDMLNMSVEDRIRQIEVNLERWRWLPERIGDRYIAINIASYELALVDSGVEKARMRVVVGTEQTGTPVFSDTITYLVINPYWQVPPKIGVLEIVPKIKEDPNYLADENLKVLRGWDDNAVEVDPRSIDWSQYNGDSTEIGRFPYRFRQDAGPNNSLGRIKFMFPNKYAVYLHGTPADHLFYANERTFSHGCIRVEYPVGLATYLLRDDPAWSAERITAEIDSDRQTTINLQRPIAIHVMYWTAWADEDGTVYFRDDIYNRDRVLATAIH